MARLPMSELAEWMAFSELEPFGSRYLEYLASLICSIFAEIHRNKKKRGKPFNPSEFFQDWGDQGKDKASTVESIIDVLKKYTADVKTKMQQVSPVDLHKPVIYDQHGRAIDGRSP